MTPHEVQRAPRYAVHLASRYRQRADLPWRYGRTENVSSSGVLFVGDVSDLILDVNTPMEMNLVMPPEIVGAAGTRVVCYGRVVRTVRPRMPDVRPAFAVTIAEYRLVRGDRDEVEEVRGTVRR
jgi:hypothetical protein